MALEFVLKLNDMMTPKLGVSMRAADSAIAQANQKAAKYAKSMSSSMEDARKKVEDLRAAANKSTDWRIYKDGMREAAKMEKQLDKLQAKAEGKSGVKMSGMLGGAVKPLLAAASMGAVMSFATSSVKAAMDFGATSKSYEVLAGNAVKGRGLAAQLNKLQQDTILGPEVFKAGQTLMSFGVSVDKVMPYVKELGDVSMGNAERFNALTLAFSQTQSAGKLMGQDLLQYVNAGFNPLQTMSEKWKDFGFKSQMSVGQLRKAMEKGAITSEMVAKSFEVATSKGGKFADMMDTIGQTSFGKMKLLEGQWENFKIQAGNALMPLASGLMDTASKTLDWLNISKSVPDTLIAEQGEANTLVGIITSLNEKNSLRATYMKDLFNKYPEMFSNLNKETATNKDLLKTLEGVNAAYKEKIELASHQLNFDTDKKRYNEAREGYLKYSTIVTSYKNDNDARGDALLPWYQSGIANPFTKSGRIAKYSAIRDSYKQDMDAAQVDFDKDARQDDIDKQKTFIQNAKKTLASATALANNKADLNKLTKSQQGAFLKEYNYAKGLHGGNQMSYDYGKLDSLMTGKTTVANTAAEDAVKASAERALSGQKTITININTLSKIDKIEMHGANLNEGFSDVERQVKEVFLRVVNSANGLAIN